MFFRRGVSRDDRWLQAKLWLFGVGALVALVGMALEIDWLIGAAGVILLAGILLRFLGGTGQGPLEDSGSPDGQA